MSGTIRDNITYGLENNSVTDEEILQAAKLAHALEFINRVKWHRYRSWRKRNQAIWRQRQRIAIARAVIHDPKFSYLMRQHLILTVNLSY